MAINIKQIIKEELVHHKLNEHIKRVEETDDSWVIEYGKAEEDMEHEEEPVEEGKVNEAKFNFSEPAVRRAAALLAKAMEKVDGVKIKVHDFEWFADEKGRKGGASFALSWDGDKHDGGSYGISDKGEVINHAYPGKPVYGNIKSSARDFEKGIRKYSKKRNESVNEAVNEGKSFYQDVIDMNKSFRLLKIQSPDSYKEIDKKFKVRDIQKLLSNMRDFMDTAMLSPIPEMREGKVNEAVNPIKLSGNLKKDLDNVTHMATKMVKYAKDNFNTYIPTGHMLSQLTVAGYKEKDVLKYNINHLAKAINKDLKKKYMKDFVAESVNEGSGKRVTKSMWQKMSDDEKENALLTVFEDPDIAQKWIGRKWNSLPGSVARDMYTESIKVSEDAKYLQVAELLKQAKEGTLDISEENAAILREKLVFYIDKKGKKRRFDTDPAANKKYRKS